MEKFTYTDGSEKQNQWAAKIAAAWMSEYDTEIENQKARQESDGMQRYINILLANRKKLVSGFENITAKQLIDMHVAKRNVASAMIDQSRNQFALQK
jgi:phage terminase Nu1 subunit (DNA packaging protein)